VPGKSVTRKREQWRNQPFDKNSEYGAGNTADGKVKQQQINSVASVTNVPAKTAVPQWKTKVREPMTTRWFGDVVRVDIDADKDRQPDCESRNDYASLHSLHFRMDE
jgi:hypothetical protein